MKLTKNATYEEIDSCTPEELIDFAERHYYEYLDYIEERAKRHPVTEQKVKKYQTPEGETVLVVENVRKK